MALGRSVVQAGAVEMVVLLPGVRPGLQEEPEGQQGGRRDGNWSESQLVREPAVSVPSSLTALYMAGLGVKAVNAKRQMAA